VYERVQGVTVIIPTFNRAAFLAEAIASAASQDVDGLRVVVSDNASEDDTPDVVARAIDEFGGEIVHYRRRPANIGWRANFNESYAAVTTEYALVLGDDDRLLPGSLRRGIDALENAPTAGMVHSAFETIDERGEIVDTATDWTKGLFEDTLERGQTFIARTIPWPSRVFTHSVVLRRTAFQQPMWDPADGLVSDYVLWLRVALDWDVLYLTTPSAQRRVHQGALSMGFGGLAGDDYRFDPEHVLELRTAKLRFIERNAERLDEPRALRRAAWRGSRRELADYARGASGTGRRAGLRALREAVSTQASVVIDPWAWRAVAKVIVGPRVSERLASG
jgi:glycosyltransferase involved in cell wall biosynthesis